MTSSRWPSFPGNGFFYSGFSGSSQLVRTSRGNSVPMSDEPSVPPSGTPRGASDKSDQTMTSSTEPIHASEVPDKSEGSTDPEPDMTRSSVTGPQQPPGTSRPSAPADGRPAPDPVESAAPSPEKSGPKQPEENPPSGGDPVPAAGGALGRARTVGTWALAAVVAGSVLLSASAGFAAGRLTSSGVQDRTAANTGGPGQRPGCDSGPGGGFPGGDQGDRGQRPRRGGPAR
jgi:hypothetical protein